MDSPDDLLTPQEVAALKKVHVNSVYRAIKEDRLAAQRRPKHYLLRRGDVDNWRARSGRYNSH